jgi:hypothetical protein
LVCLLVSKLVTYFTNRACFLNGWLSYVLGFGGGRGLNTIAILQVPGGGLVKLLYLLTWCISKLISILFIYIIMYLTDLLTHLV